MSAMCSSMNCFRGCVFCSASKDFSIRPGSAERAMASCRCSMAENRLLWLRLKRCRAPTNGCIWCALMRDSLASDSSLSKFCAGALAGAPAPVAVRGAVAAASSPARPLATGACGSAASGGKGAGAGMGAGAGGRAGNSGRSAMPAMAFRVWSICAAFAASHASAPASSRRDSCTIRSTPDSSTSTRSGVSFKRPCWAATKLSSMPCASCTTTCRPTMAAAPLIEWAARIIASTAAASPAWRSMASKPSVRIWVWLSASMRNRSSMEKALRSPCWSWLIVIVSQVESRSAPCRGSRCACRLR
ncbi:hypothetical protein D3C85_154840 [compost metagenome]